MKTENLLLWGFLGFLLLRPKNQSAVGLVNQGRKRLLIDFKFSNIGSGFYVLNFGRDKFTSWKIYPVIGGYKVALGTDENSRTITEYWYNVNKQGQPIQTDPLKKPSEIFRTVTEAKTAALKYAKQDVYNLEY